MQLSGIAAKVKFQALKKRAGECMEAIAKSRKMTRDELEDRIVPDAGFDDDGKRVLDFGARKILRRDRRGGCADGSRRVGRAQSGPSETRREGRREARGEIDRGSEALEEDAPQGHEDQVVRLEQAMVKGRTWNAKDFTTLVAKHPLMKNLAHASFGTRKGSKIRRRSASRKTGRSRTKRMQIHAFEGRPRGNRDHSIDGRAEGRVGSGLRRLRSCSAPFENSALPNVRDSTRRKRRRTISRRYSKARSGDLRVVGSSARARLGARSSARRRLRRR